MTPRLCPSYIFSVFRVALVKGKATDHHVLARRLKCRVTGFAASLSFFSTSRKCSQGNVRNVSFRISLRWSICHFNPVDKPSLEFLFSTDALRCSNTVYYMTSSVSGQDEPNRALWLATRAGKMERYCPLGISRLVPQDQRSFFGVLSHIINPLLTKIVRSRWLDIGLVLFLRVYGPRLRLGP